LESITNQRSLINDPNCGLEAHDADMRAQDERLTPSMNTLKVTIADEVFEARLELERAPKTCAAFIARLPFKSQIVHVRWSGEGVWIPLGDYKFGVDYENHTSYPAPGQVLLYPGGISETEILLAYGGVQFACKMGQLAGNHFLTLNADLDRLAELGKRALWQGAQPILFEKP
jgi:hypothetical protein